MAITIEKKAPPVKLQDVEIFKTCEAGDSFACNVRMYRHARQWFKKNNKKIVTRREDVNRYRIWIIE